MSNDTGTTDATDPPVDRLWTGDREFMAEASIHQLIATILSQLPAIGKLGKAPVGMGGYAFRGIEDVMNALNPIMSQFGVFFMPTVLERLDGTRPQGTNRDGTPKMTNVVNLHVAYDWYAPNGSSVRCSVWGEGTDNGDKATQKALTAAMKYMLFQTLAISTEEGANLDSERQDTNESGDVSVPRPTRAAEPTPVEKTDAEMEAERKAAWGDKPVPAGWASFEQMDRAHAQLTTGISTMTDGNRALLKEFRKTNSMGWPMPLDHFNLVLDEVTRLNATPA